MSKNLSEETPGKVVASQGYGVRQLFRRPAPISDTSGGLPKASMQWIGDGSTIPVNSPYNTGPSVGAGNDLVDIAPWEAGYASNPELFYPDLDNGRFNLYPEGSSDPRTAGVYAVNITVDWSENWDNGDLYAMVNYRAGTSMDFEGWQTKVVYAKTQGASNLLTFDESVVLTDIISIVPNADGEATNSFISGALMHKGGGGSARILSQVTMTIVRLSTYVVDELTFYPSGT